MSSQNNENKKKKGGGVTLLVFLLIFLLPRLFELLEDLNLGRMFRRWSWELDYWLFRNRIPIRGETMLWILIILAVVLIVTLIAKAKGGRKPREDGSVFNSATGRTTAATQRPDPRTRSFTAPDPSCIVCDHTGEDHFVRDKAQRIAQLNEWLKNGLIDREEYRVLKSRYERDL